MKQLECFNCKTIVVGREIYLEGRKCPNCDGPTIIKPFNPTDKHMSYKDAVSVWRRK